MFLRRTVFQLLVMGCLAFPCATAWAQDDESDESGTITAPIAQYAVAIIFSSLAIGSVIRSSRRHWN